MKSLKIHIVYEYGSDLRPHASTYIRLIRPLTYPTNESNLEVSFSPRVVDYPVDAVIVDRLWRPDITPVLADELVENVRKKKASLIYAIDDNLLDLHQEREDWPLAHHLEAFEILLRQADQVWVATAALKERLAHFNSHIIVIPNSMDERLISRYRQTERISPFNGKPITIGFMGTTTHDKDLLMVAPALHELWKRHPNLFRIELVGVIGNPASLEALEEIPVRTINPPLEEQEYPLFLFWFSSHANWDIAIAPLVDTPFTRCKSDIKFLDYCAIGAAGIYSDVAAYASSVRHLETGMLVENRLEAWVEALDKLVVNEDVREKISTNANHYLFTERTLANTSSMWRNSLANLAPI